jgi:hypothetical protein
MFADLHADAEVTPPCARFARYRERERDRDLYAGFRFRV